jgi:hypothetical protein
MTDPFSSFWGLFEPIMPVTNWQRFFNPQIIFNENPGDQAIESHVLSKVGSYGHQISTLMWVIDALIKQIPESDWTKDQREAVTAFKALESKSRSAVVAYRNKWQPDDVVSAVKAMTLDEGQKRALLGRLADALGLAYTASAV